MVEDEVVDLFENYEALPEDVKVIMHSAHDGGNPYVQCEEMLAKLEPLGYEFEYGLCGEPFNLRKIKD